MGAFSRFIAGELREGNAVVAVVTAAHERSLQSSLEASYVDVALAIRQQRYLPVNVSELLAKATVDGCLDPLRYLDTTGDLLTDVTRRATDQHARVAACGEGASISGRTDTSKPPFNSNTCGTDRDEPPDGYPVRVPAGRARRKRAARKKALCGAHGRRDQLTAAASQTTLRSQRLHDLRHTVVTRLLEAGEPDHVVESITGHPLATDARAPFAHPPQCEEGCARSARRRRRSRAPGGSPIPPVARR